MTRWPYNLSDVRGHVIESVEFARADNTLKITFEDGDTHTYAAEGDCCSESWIEHVTIPPDIAGAVVRDFKRSEGVKPTPEQLAHSAEERQYGVDQLLVYNEAFVTDRGEIVVEHRNNSNGYYGGVLVEVRS